MSKFRAWSIMRGLSVPHDGPGCSWVSNLKIPGRSRLLIVSVMTMNGISMVGVPWGTKCKNMWLVEE